MPVTTSPTPRQLSSLWCSNRSFGSDGHEREADGGAEVARAVVEHGCECVRGGSTERPVVLTCEKLR
jgi:hypothetical protein